MMRSVTDEDRHTARLIELGRDREAAELGAATTPWRPSATAARRIHGTTGAARRAGARAGRGRGRDHAGRSSTTRRRAPTSPCAGVLDHMIGGATAFAAAFRGERGTRRRPTAATRSPTSGSALGDLVAAMHEPGALDRTVAGAVRRGAGRRTFARFVVLDGLVHGWDLSTATGQPYDPPERLVAEVDEFARNTRRPAARRRHVRRGGRTTGRRHRHRTARGLHRAANSRRELDDHHPHRPSTSKPIKTRQQVTWSSGNYAVIGTTLQIVGEKLCEAVDVVGREHRARRRRRQRQRVAGGRPPRRPGDRGRLRARSARTARRPGRGRGPDDRRRAWPTPRRSTCPTPASTPCSRRSA